MVPPRMSNYVRKALRGCNFSLDCRHTPRWHTTSHNVGEERGITQTSPAQTEMLPTPAPGRPSYKHPPQTIPPSRSLGGQERAEQGQGGQGAVTVPQMGAPSHIVFHSQGPGDREGRGRSVCPPPKAQLAHSWAWDLGEAAKVGGSEKSAWRWPIKGTKASLGKRGQE